MYPSSQVSKKWLENDDTARAENDKVIAIHTGYSLIKTEESL
jgi:hypothetical protein